MSCLLDAERTEEDNGRRRENLVLTEIHGLRSVSVTSWIWSCGAWTADTSRAFAANVTCGCVKPCRTLDARCVVDALARGRGKRKAAA